MIKAWMMKILSSLFTFYSSAYPPAQSSTYVKATSTTGSYYAYQPTNPALSLTGGWAASEWESTANTNQRFHIDLGFAQVINRIYYENSHNSGTQLTYGAKTFTFWGSNTVGDFNDTTYGDDGTWVQLTCSQSTLDQHSAADAPDPKYITVTNTTAYRYYAFKFADNWGGAGSMQIRRIELQYSSQYKSQYPPAQSTTWVKANYYSSSYYPWFTTDPTHSLSGSGAGLYWFNNSPTNNRFHIDLGCPEIINRIYYENHHNGGADTDWGAKTFTLWGSNTASAFADLTYGDDTNWTQITGLSQSTLDQHTAADFPDPKFITITGNTTAFRYYAFKFADNWTNGSDMGVRRIELQTDKPFFFPPLNNAVYVEATTQDIGNSYQATDKTLALTGAAAGNSWIATATGSQRFHIDLAFAQVINKLYYENYHNSGANTTRGAKTFTLWGSNTASAFADLTYGDDTNWTQITGLSQSTFDQHTGSDIADPKFITFPNTTAFRYYAIKIADNWTDGTYVGLRRIQLQCTQ